MMCLSTAARPLPHRTATCRCKGPTDPHALRRLPSHCTCYNPVLLKQISPPPAHESFLRVLKRCLQIFYNNVTSSVSEQIAAAVANNPATLVLSVNDTVDGTVVTFTSTSATSAAAPDPARGNEGDSKAGAGVVSLIVILVLVVVGLIVLVILKKSGRPRSGRKVAPAPGAGSTTSLA